MKLCAQSIQRVTPSTISAVVVWGGPLCKRGTIADSSRPRPFLPIRPPPDSTEDSSSDIMGSGGLSKWLLMRGQRPSRGLVVERLGLVEVRRARGA